MAAILMSAFFPGKKCIDHISKLRCLSDFDSRLPEHDSFATWLSAHWWTVQVCRMELQDPDFLPWVTTTLDTTQVTAMLANEKWFADRPHVRRGSELLDRLAPTVAV